MTVILYLKGMNPVTNAKCSSWEFLARFGGIVKGELQVYVCLELCAAVCLCWDCVSVKMLVDNGLGC